jgi:hypothetical protein
MFFDARGFADRSREALCPGRLRDEERGLAYVSHYIQFVHFVYNKIRFLSFNQPIGILPFAAIHARTQSNDAPESYGHFSLPAAGSAIDGLQP